MQAASCGTVLALVAALAVASALPGCGEDPLEAANAEIEAIEGQVEQARAEVERRDAAAGEADEALERARAELTEAEQRLADARERLQRRSGDTLVFRTVQQRLLDADELDGAAVRAHVQRNVVTLEGNVVDEAQKLAAERIARETRGVETVVNQISVDVAAPPE